MWPFRNTRNRRAERSSVLDVRMRSVAGRRARRRTALMAFGFTIMAATAIVAGSFGWEWLRTKVTDSRFFALTTIDISTDGIWLTAAQVRQWTGVQEGENLLFIDMPRIRRDLELIPQVESAAVERVLPHLLRIRVTEREPVAQVQALQPEGVNDVAPALYYLDAAGVVMPPLPPTRSPALVQALENLPLLRGISNAELRPGQPVGTRTLQAALQFLGEFERSALATHFDLQSLDIASPDVLRVTTSTGAEVNLSYGRAQEQLARWWLIHQAGSRMARTIAALDLSITNNCPVLWLEASAAPAPKPKPAKPGHWRKKHV